jgi:uncharacterized protein (DUF2141 family)
MRTILSIFIFLFFSLLNVFPQYSLKVEVAGLRNNTGNVLFELYSGNHDLVKQEMGSIKQNICIVKFENLKPGKYAIRYFHDENKNLKMETNIVGIPTEGYGFSNNVLSKFGPPSFDKWIFDIKENLEMKLKIKYH